MGKIIIKKYQNQDRKFLEDICYNTGLMGEAASSFWGHKKSFVGLWLSYYLNKEPQHTYVALVNGKVVGYLTGCLDSNQYNEKWIFIKIIFKYLLLIRPSTKTFFRRSLKDMKLNNNISTSGLLHDKRWPAHLHINLSKDARGKGIGSKLITTWLNFLKENDIKGCHLSTMAENTSAITFFEKQGFRKYGDNKIIAGFRDKNGNLLHQQFMVWDNNK